ncbi:MAG: SusC/RagA family TonB-linked outer membrane protein, partial [Chitinophagia bacterium]|nr:SusC/RagA family TonB-linked outer membrane protein [Chitinophagia bacterium]
MKKGLGRMMAWLVAACLALPATAQQARVITGRVTDESQAPLSNVTVQVKGEGQTVRTGADGRFSVQAGSGVQTLVFSFVGMQTAEQAVAAGASTVSLVMKRSDASLQEVVVVSTGYQTLPKERATGSFGTVSREQLDKPATNIASRIIGTNAGVQALRMDEEGNPFFQIRGLSTLYANQEPLVVVDGFPIQGTYNAINPNDVESVTILKDAAAASIWGARAVNGVIVVTTKNAGKGTPLKVEFSAFTRIASKIDLDYARPHASAAETVEYEKLAYNKWGAQLNTGILANHVAWNWTPAQLALNEANLGFITAGQRDKTLDSLKGLDNRSQISDLLLAKPVTQQYNLSLFSATQRMSQSLSLLMEKNQSNFRETFNDRQMMNYRTTASLARWLDLSLNTMLQYNRFTSNGSSLSEITSLSSYEMLANPNGTLTETTLRYYLPLIRRQVPVNLFPYNDWSYNPAREIYS